VASSAFEGRLRRRGRCSRRDRHQEWTKPIWRPVRARPGRDWMINSGVTRFDVAKAGPRTHKLAAAIFATYPVWALWLGMRGKRARGAERER
jgi:hypothetical protein